MNKQLITAIMSLLVMALQFCVLSMELDFNVDSTPENVKPYGDGTTISIVQTQQKKNAIQVVFDDSSKRSWCNKGFAISLPRAVSWDDIDFVEFQIVQPSRIKMIACTLNDENGHVWYSFLKSGSARKTVKFEKDSFRYSYSKDKQSSRPDRKSGKIISLLLYIGTSEVNTGTKYHFTLEKMKFGKNQNIVAMEIVPNSGNTVPFGTFGDIKKPISDTVKTEISDGVIKVKFNDKSPTWFHKGVRIKLDRPMDWNEFAGISFDYKLNQPARMVAMCMLDDRGVWWECFKSHPAKDLPGTAAFESVSFHRSELTYRYDDRPHQKKGKIVELYPFFGIVKGNCGIQYEGEFSNIKFIKEFAVGHYQYEVVDDFPLQWKNNNLTADGTVYVDGKPFFPLLLYTSIGLDVSSANMSNRYGEYYDGPTDEATNRKRFKTIADAGFNVVMSYSLNRYGQSDKVSGIGWKPSERSKFSGPNGETTEELYQQGVRRFLDYCHEAGLKAMVGANSTYTLPLPLPMNNRRGVWESHKKRIANTINLFKKHPALLFWYMYDEPSSMNTPVNDLVQTYQYAKKLDQDHPFFMAAADPRNDRDYFPAVDIVAPDSYPLAFNKPITNDMNLMPYYRNAQKKGWPVVYQIILISQWRPELQQQLPTIEQIRTMCFLGLVDNLKGLCFYHHSNYPEKRPEQWENIGKAVNSLHSFIPDILASEKTLGSCSADSSDVKMILHQVKGKDYLLLLAVNGKENYTDTIPRKPPVPVALGNVKFKLNGFRIKRIEALDEDESGQIKLGNIRNIPADNDGFSDDFGIYATHAYRIYLK